MRALDPRAYPLILLIDSGWRLVIGSPVRKQMGVVVVVIVEEKLDSHLCKSEQFLFISRGSLDVSQIFPAIHP